MMSVLAAAFRRRLSTGKIKRRMLFLLIILLLAFNFTDIVRFFCPIPYRDVIFSCARQYDVDPFLIAAIIKTESSFLPEAVSGSGACGLMQIMPETGRWIVSQMGEPSISEEKLFDPETNIKLGTWYVADLEKEFYGDSVLVLAAYNGGRGNVQYWLEQNNLSGEEDRINAIPFPETRLFVQKVLLYQRIYRYLYDN